MSRSARRWLAVAAGAALAAPMITTAPAVAHDGHEHHDDYQVLVYTHSEEAAQPSTAKGVNAIRTLGKNNGFTIDVSRNGTSFTSENLANYAAVVFINNTGDVLDDAQQEAFEDYIKAGGGYLGVHLAVDAEPDWAFYRGLVGTTSTGTTANGAGVIDVADRYHPSTAKMPREVIVEDEYLNYTGNVRGVQHVLASVDPTSLDGSSMGADHPISWCQDYQGGRSWYTGLGASADTFTIGAVRKHLLGGIEWAAGIAEGDCGATVESNYERVVLNDQPGEPMTLAVLPDGRVLHNTRAGEIRLYDPATGASPVINNLDVYQHDEDGLQSVTLDPNFAENKWVYLYYAPPLDTPVDDPATPGVNEGDAPANSDDPSVWEPFKGYNLLSRVKFVEEPTPHLDMSTEQEIIKVDVDRGACCHVAGEVKFDGRGLLYLVTGDDTNASGSDGYTPINRSATRGPAYDAARSSANTNDLRGKVLRIRVKDDGSYSIPAGNLFRESQDVDDKTRPEIFLMGLRNPFRFDVDDRGFVYIGDYSPDSRNPDPQRGPEGTGRWFATKTAGNYGWPYCYSPTLPYVDYDFETETSGEPFNCAAPINDSPRNTGLSLLPPVEQPQFWYTFNATTTCRDAYLVDPAGTCDFQWPVIGTGGVGPMGGPIYKYDDSLESEYKLPAYYHDTVFFGEFSRDRMFNMRTNGSGKFFGVEAFLPGFTFDNPMDMEIGPDGTLYVLDYGDGFFRANPDASLYQIRYVKGTRGPVAELDVSPTSGQAPLNVQFSSEGSFSPEVGETISIAWDFDGDGTTDSTEANPSFTYTSNGVYYAQLTVTDSTGKQATLSRTITVGNTAPTVEVTLPVSGSFFNWGDTVPYAVTVTDPEDGTIDCDRVEVTFVLGHDEHGHPQTSTTGCTGTLPTPADGADHAGSYLFGGISARYTDLGGGGQPALTTVGQATIQVYQQQAEYAQIKQGVETSNTTDTGGGLHVSSIDGDDYIAFDPINLDGIESLTLRHSRGSSSTVGDPRAIVEVRVDAPDGPLVASTTLNATSGSRDWTSHDVAIDHPAGTHQLYLVFRTVDGGPDSNLVYLNWVQFNPAS
ncbi:MULTISPECIES: ThuA domain-containing protein [unclassified Solwaraspora]|uniref:ThuA domain-containing protein n=1 Tax=unclassified Solwaraspora TaxID=2627926 RepID=UPI00248AAB6E|nr:MULTISPECIES: ThuA domain-containing protein [unclassified Solwaraspora]WBB95351.1 ThuA domain-containing protein [Solwaraspora sp. WMMA2059]WBC20743.1 ThuA domain-containing protein [Solwaraspora sp. WMMA2080]WJK37124.1 ThuA domain-containing protein [Solwaraspora sp. WMMA2065]